jgi:hypothetical protein
VRASERERAGENLVRVSRQHPGAVAVLLAQQQLPSRHAPVTSESRNVTGQPHPSHAPVTSHPKPVRLRSHPIASRSRSSHVPVTSHHKSVTSQPRPGHVPSRPGMRSRRASVALRHKAATPQSRRTASQPRPDPVSPTLPSPPRRAHARAWQRDSCAETARERERSLTAAPRQRERERAVSTAETAVAAASRPRESSHQTTVDPQYGQTKKEI